MSRSEKWVPKSGKRVVSKGEYVRQLVKQAGIENTALVVLLLSGIYACGTLCCVFVVASSVACTLRKEMTIEWPFIFVGVTLLLLGISSRVLWVQGFRMIDYSRSIEIGIPLTRANTGDLPAPDSLVRDSAEPVQEQEAVLLRAATQASETPAEQLVRPAAGQE